MAEKTPALFLDRDGTINDDPGYLGDPAKVFLFPGIAEALSSFQKKTGWAIIIITNQAGIARGLLTHNDVAAVNNKVTALLGEQGVQISGIYYCPFHPEFSTPDECECRKPSPAMVLKAAEEHNIDLSSSYFIGDSEADVQCGLNAGLRSVLVFTGNGRKHIDVLKRQNTLPHLVAESLKEACEIILEEIQK